MFAEIVYHAIGFEFTGPELYDCEPIVTRAPTDIICTPIKNA